jgi:hypothetical protein
MYAISIKQPWAWAILYAGKDVENRSWVLPTKYTNVPLWLHTGQTYDIQGADFMSDRLGVDPPNNLPLGAIVGNIQFKDCVQKSNSRWFFGPYGWVVDKVKPLPNPVTCKGQLKFWEPKDLVKTGSVSVRYIDTLIQKLQNIDVLRDPIQARDQLEKLSVDILVFKPDIVKQLYLAIRYCGSDPYRVHEYIFGPSDVGSGKGLINDLYVLRDKLKAANTRIRYAGHTYLVKK